MLCNPPSRSEGPQVCGGLGEESKRPSGQCPEALSALWHPAGPCVALWAVRKESGSGIVGKDAVVLCAIPVCWCPSSWHRPGVNTPRINPRSPRLGPLLPPAAHTQDETFRALFCWGAELRRLSPPPQPWPAKDAEAGAGVRLSYRGLCGGRFPVPSHSPALAGPIGFDEEKQACGVGTQQEGIELDWSPLGGSSQALRTPFP